MAMRLDGVALLVRGPQIVVAVIAGESPRNDVLDLPCLATGYPALADVAAVAGSIEDALTVFAGEALAGGHMALPARVECTTSPALIDCKGRAIIGC